MANEEGKAKEIKKDEVAKEESGKAKTKYVSKIGIAFTAAFMVLFTVFLIYCLVQFWPEAPSEESVVMVEEAVPAEETPPPTEEIPTPPETELPVEGEVSPAREEGASVEETVTPPEKTKAMEIAKVETPEKTPISDEARLLVLIVLGGAIGAMVRALRSFSWYVGHRELKSSWLVMYFLLPFVGATIGLVFYLVIRGGFFSTSATIKDTSPYGFVALAALVGLFSEQAVLKLKEIAETMLKGAEKGEDTVESADEQQSSEGNGGEQGE